MSAVFEVDELHDLRRKADLLFTWDDIDGLYIVSSRPISQTKTPYTKLGVTTSKVARIAFPLYRKHKYQNFDVLGRR